MIVSDFKDKSVRLSGSMEDVSVELIQVLTGYENYAKDLGVNVCAALSAAFICASNVGCEDEEEVSPDDFQMALAIALLELNKSNTLCQKAKNVIADLFIDLLKEESEEFDVEEETVGKTVGTTENTSTSDILKALSK